MPFTVNIKYESNGKNVANAKVTMTNTTTSDVIEGNTDENGNLKLSSVPPGVYNITSSITLSKEEYESLTGETTRYKEIHFGGIQEKVTVNANISSTSFTIANGNLGDLVIKQYYSLLSGKMYIFAHGIF